MVAEGVSDGGDDLQRGDPIRLSRTPIGGSVLAPVTPVLRDPAVRGTR
jgi:hypothetical protein